MMSGRRSLHDIGSAVERSALAVAATSKSSNAANSNEMDVLVQGVADVTKGRGFTTRFVRLSRTALEYFDLEDAECVMPKAHIRLIDIAEVNSCDNAFEVYVVGKRIEFRPHGPTSDWTAALPKALLAAAVSQSEATANDIGSNGIGRSASLADLNSSSSVPSSNRPPGARRASETLARPFARRLSQDVELKVAQEVEKKVARLRAPSLTSVPNLQGSSLGLGPSFARTPRQPMISAVPQFSSGISVCPPNPVARDTSTPREFLRRRSVSPQWIDSCSSRLRVRTRSPSVSSRSSSQERSSNEFARSRRCSTPATPANLGLSRANRHSVAGAPPPKSRSSMQPGMQPGMSSTGLQRTPSQERSSTPSSTYPSERRHTISVEPPPQEEPTHSSISSYTQRRHTISVEPPAQEEPTPSSMISHMQRKHTISVPTTAQGEPKPRVIRNLRADRALTSRGSVTPQCDAANTVEDDAANAVEDDAANAVEEVARPSIPSRGYVTPQNDVANAVESPSANQEVPRPSASQDAIAALLDAAKTGCEKIDALLEAAQPRTSQDVFSALLDAAEEVAQTNHDAANAVEEVARPSTSQEVAQPYIGQDAVAALLDAANAAEEAAQPDANQEVAEPHTGQGAVAALLDAANDAEEAAEPNTNKDAVATLLDVVTAAEEAARPSLSREAVQPLMAGRQVSTPSRPAAPPFAKRLEKERGNLNTLSEEDGIFAEDTSSFSTWRIALVGSPDTLYAGERYCLRFAFPENYPMDAPEVVFVGQKVPAHPHIYSNGHICLSVLYDQWSPSLSVHALCASILSMLSSSPAKSRPHDDADYVATHRRRSPKETKWDFDDDTV